MTFKSYAQNFEDVILWRALHDAKVKSYLDIGAQDPTLDSVSLAFYEAGWRGTHVEPTPAYASMLRAARPDETVIEAAVSQSPGPLELYEFPGTGLSTGVSEIASKHAGQGHQTRSILVPTIRLEDLLAQTGDVAWMKIDVEGMEFDVLTSWGECPVRPWILVIEATAPNTQDLTGHEWRELVTSKGYHEVFWDGLSLYFLHESQSQRAAAFCNPISIFDDFAVGRNHFLARLLAEELYQTELQLADMRALETELSSRLAETQKELDELQSNSEALQAQLVDLAAALETAKANETSALWQLSKAESVHRTALETLEEKRQCTEAAVQLQLAELTQQIAQYRKQFAGELEYWRQLALRADALIRAVLATKKRRFRQIAEALGLVGPSHKWRLLGAWSLSNGLVSQQVEIPKIVNHEANNRMEGQTRNLARDPYLRANSLAELLSWHDMDFVRCAYVTILGRQPDHDGQAFYLDRLRSGHSKMKILWQLRRSAEAKRHDPGISGLDRSLKRSAWARLPLVGIVVRWIFKEESDDRLARIHRSITNELYAIKGILGYNDPTIDWAQHSQADGRSHQIPEWQTVGRDETKLTVGRNDLSPSVTKSLRILVGESTR